MSGRPEQIGVVGCGRMGIGIAQAFAIMGTRVLLLDIKERGKAEREDLFLAAAEDIRQEGKLLAEVEMVSTAQAGTLTSLVEFASADDYPDLAGIPLFFEAVPEVVEVKKQAFRWMTTHLADDVIIASTTSSMLVTELAEMVGNPARFLNAHWLNPAYLMPLVEVSKGDQTEVDTVERLVAILENIGKVPVVCAASPGYIVPRIQSLAMNEAVRMVEEGVASAEDIDKAVRVGFGIRFAILGLLEFTDWGGGDILYYGSNYLAGAISKERFTPPEVVERNMRENRTGLRDREGFLNYQDMDIDEYRKGRLKEFVSLLGHMELLPDTRGRP